MHRKSRDGIQDRTFKAKDSYESFLVILILIRKLFWNGEFHLLYFHLFP